MNLEEAKEIIVETINSPYDKAFYKSIGITSLDDVTIIDPIESMMYIVGENLSKFIEGDIDPDIEQQICELYNVDAIGKIDDIYAKEEAIIQIIVLTYIKDIQKAEQVMLDYNFVNADIFTILDEYNEIAYFWGEANKIREAYLDEFKAEWEDDE